MAVYKGHEGEIKKLTDTSTTTTAYVTSFSVENAPNVDPVYEMGSRNPTKFKKGNEEITGSFDKMYVNTDWIDDAHTDTIVSYKFEGIVDTAAGSLTLTLSEVTLTNWSFDLPEDDFITESVDFQAKNMSTSSP